MSTTSASQSPLVLSAKYPNVQITPRPSQERGNANHGWLKSFHTFNFASYYDPEFEGFGALRVINEDRVEPGTGFGAHTHREMEIFSYIVSGELEHKDSMGNTEIMKRGDVQMTSAGTGIAHSEYNRNKKQPVHFLQIWVNPSTSRLTPKYFTRHFTDNEKKNALVQVVAPLSSSAVIDAREGKGPVPIHAGISVFASILTPGATVTHRLGAKPLPGRKAYIHVIQTSGYNAGPGNTNGAAVRINGGVQLQEGDGAFVTSTGAGEGDAIEFESVGSMPAEFLVFDIE